MLIIQIAAWVFLIIVVVKVFAILFQPKGTSGLSYTKDEVIDIVLEDKYFKSLKSSDPKVRKEGEEAMEHLAFRMRQRKNKDTAPDDDSEI